MHSKNSYAKTEKLSLFSDFLILENITFQMNYGLNLSATIIFL